MNPFGEGCLEVRCKSWDLETQKPFFQFLFQGSVNDQGFLNGFAGQYKEAIAELAKWYEEGKLIAKETVMDGIENLGNAFVSVLTGGNIGKQLVKVG